MWNWAYILRHLIFNFPIHAVILEQQSDIEERHQRALEEIQASSDAIQGALLSQVEQLQQEKLQVILAI